MALLYCYFRIHFRDQKVIVFHFKMVVAVKANDRCPTLRTLEIPHELSANHFKPDRVEPDLVLTKGYFLWLWNEPW